eukprot:1066605_1
MVLSGAIADWYFSDWNMEKNSKVRGYNTAELSYSPILESFFRVLRFHLGSLALGALIITIIRIIRACVTFIDAIRSPPINHNSYSYHSSIDAENNSSLTK